MISPSTEIVVFFRFNVAEKLDIDRTLGCQIIWKPENKSRILKSI